MRSLRALLGLRQPLSRGWGLQPRAPGFNVTLTFSALAYWVASALVDGVVGRGAYTAGQVAASTSDLLRVLAAVDPDTMIADTL